MIHLVATALMGQANTIETDVSGCWLSETKGQPAKSFYHFGRWAGTVIARSFNVPHSSNGNQ